VPHESITVITSFRSFVETSENTRIQKSFLASISEFGKSNQVELIAVQWSETGVEEELTRANIPYQVIRLGDQIPYFRYSLSEVLENAIPLATGNIIIYTTCDVEFHKGFLERIQDLASKYDLIIPFPYIEMEIHRVGKNVKKIQRVSSSGLDVFIFSLEALKKLHTRGYFRRYVFVGYGMFDHFLLLASLQQKFSVLKISMENQITKHVNDRNQNEETEEWLTVSHTNNAHVLRQCINLNMIYLPLLTLKGVYFAISGAKLGFKQITEFVGLRSIWYQLKFLLLKSIQRQRHSLPKG